MGVIPAEPVPDPDRGAGIQIVERPGFHRRKDAPRLNFDGKLKLEFHRGISVDSFSANAMI